MTASTTFIFLGICLLSWSIGRVMLPFGITFLQHNAIVSKNYLGHDTPNSYGVVHLSAFMGMYVLLSVFFLVDRFSIGNASLFWAVGMASSWIVLLGWLDDTLGNHEAKGFKGHLNALKREGIISTGLLKAIGGGVIAIIVAVVTSHSVLEWMIHALLIALATNWLNLLDLRPGRSAKFYLFTAAILCALAWPQPFLLLFVPLILLAAATIKADLSGHIMLGDSGANLFGMQVGILAALSLPLFACVTVVLLLLAGHVYAERRSITALITRIAWLQKLDNWGRVKP